jgi:hypothetical protein
VEKKDRVHLSKDAVPTIFFKQSTLGLEMVQVPFDEVNHQYFGQESLELLRGKISFEDEEALAIKRQQRLEELKNLCRFCFCFELKNESKCVTLTKLDSYQINLNDLLVSLGLPQESNEIFGELICEQCFQQIVEIDLFKKKCRDAQEEVITEIQELDNKMQEIRSTKDSGKAWHKNEVGLAVDDSQVEATPIEILEEHLVDEGEFDDANYQYEPQLNEQQLEASEEYIEEIHEGYKIIYQQVCESNDDRVVSETDMITEDNLDAMHDRMDIQVIQEIDPQDVKEDKTLLQGVDEYFVASTDDIIKNPERNRFCFRIYECFFCKMKFAGRKTYIAHKCSVLEVKCEQCDKMFSKIQTYNNHVSHVHGSLPLLKHFCPVCKTVVMSTLYHFKQHRRQCNKRMKNQPIECEVCSKMCSSLKGYTIHKLFHDTRNFTTSTGEKIVSDGLNAFKGSAICEVRSEIEYPS